MTVLGRLLTRSSIEGAKPLTDVTLADWLSGSTSSAGVAVTEQRVLGLPAYYRAVALTAGTLAALPLHLFRTGTRKRFTQPTVLAKPNPRQTEVEWRLTAFTHGITWGNSFHRKLRDGSDAVRQVWPIHPSRVRVVDVDPTDLNPAGKIFLVSTRSGEKRYTSWDILHIPYVSADGLIGIRPLETFRHSLGISIAADDTAASFFRNGGRPSGVLTSKLDLSKGAADRLKARWATMVSGPSNAGNIAVLDNETTFQSLDIHPQDAQLLQSRQWSVTEIARMVGVPPHLVGDVERSTSWGTGIEQQTLAWVKFSLQLWITLHEQRYDLELVPSAAYTKHSLEGLLRGDSQARAAFYQSGIVNGWMSRNEVRDLEEREAVEGLDEFIVPSNMTLISVDGQIVPLSSASSTDT